MREETPSRAGLPFQTTGGHFSAHWPLHVDFGVGPPRSLSNRYRIQPFPSVTTHPSFALLASMSCNEGAAGGVSAGSLEFLLTDGSGLVAAGDCAGAGAALFAPYASPGTDPPPHAAKSAETAMTPPAAVAVRLPAFMLPPGRVRIPCPLTGITRIRCGWFSALGRDTHQRPRGAMT